MDTKLKRLLKKRKMTQSTLYNKIAKKYETPVGQYALSEIVNGKKLNYHLITLVKICDVLNVKPNTIVESEELIQQLVKVKESPSVEHDGMKYNPENPKETLEFTDEQDTIVRNINDLDKKYPPKYEF